MTGRFPVILSSPSGGGKTTIAKELLRRRFDLGYSVSGTTRTARPGEADGVDYYFMSPEQFQEAQESGEFADQILVDRGLAIGRALVLGRHAQRLPFLLVIAAMPSIASA